MLHMICKLGQKQSNREQLLKLIIFKYSKAEWSPWFRGHPIQSARFAWIFTLHQSAWPTVATTFAKNAWVECCQLLTMTKTSGIVRNVGQNKIKDSNSWLEISFWSVPLKSTLRQGKTYVLLTSHPRNFVSFLNVIASRVSKFLNQKTVKPI